jgi:hypothetical protein
MQRQQNVHTWRWNFTAYLSSCKERGFTLEGAKTHLKEGQKKTLDKFEIIRKLETIRTQLTNIKINFKKINMKNSCLDYYGRYYWNVQLLKEQ